MINYDFCSEKESDGLISVDGVLKELSEKEKEICVKSFYESVVEYISYEFVNVVLVVGFRDNIIVMVIFFSGSEYVFDIKGKVFII